MKAEVMSNVTFFPMDGFTVIPLQFMHTFFFGGGGYAVWAVEILVPGPEIKPTSPAVEVQRS